MTDIVSWLRGRQETLNQIEKDCEPAFRNLGFRDEVRARFGEAADEIEALRVKIKSLEG